MSATHVSRVSGIAASHVLRRTFKHQDSGSGLSGRDCSTERSVPAPDHNYVKLFHASLLSPGPHWTASRHADAQPRSSEFLLVSPRCIVAPPTPTAIPSREGPTLPRDRIPPCFPHSRSIPRRNALESRHGMPSMPNISATREASIDVIAPDSSRKRASVVKMPSHIGRDEAGNDLPIPDPRASRQSLLP
jgi:hypothetical protein